LCPDFEDVLERHARVCELALEEHDHVRLVLVQLALVGCPAARASLLADVCLQRSDLLVHAGNVLLDDVRELLHACQMSADTITGHGSAHANLHRPVVE
jgi:hypothetical protein